MAKKQLVLCLTLTVLGLMLSFSTASADMIDVRIVSDYGRDYPIYRTDRWHSGLYRAYVEAVKRDRYGIHIINNTDRRIGLVVAVDGRNILSGKKSYLARDEKMYVIEPHSMAVYDGWRTAKDYINRFFFTDAPDSYAGAWGDYSAMGVVAIAVYPEVRRYKIYPQPEPLREGRDYSKRQRESASSEPGTGFGEREYSPTRKVKFEPEKRPAERYFFKYEWRETLCKKGIAHDCYPYRERDRNRFWNDRDDKGYAPPPPQR